MTVLAYIPPMHVSRLSAAFSTLLLLQLVFVGSGYVCSAMGVPGMSSGRMDAMDMGGPARVDQHAPAPTPANDHGPCRFPWAPDGCQSMAPCSPAAVTSETLTLVSPPTIISVAPELSVLTPPSQTSPPELPPPRA